MKVLSIMKKIVLSICVAVLGLCCFGAIAAYEEKVEANPQRLAIYTLKRAY